MMMDYVSSEIGDNDNAGTSATAPPGHLAAGREPGGAGRPTNHNSSQLAEKGICPMTITLQPIDGGPTYYADHGFTNAVSMGWDNPNFFPNWPI